MKRTFSTWPAGQTYCTYYCDSASKKFITYLKCQMLRMHASMTFTYILWKLQSHYSGSYSYNIHAQKLSIYYTIDELLA